MKIYSERFGMWLRWNAVTAEWFLTESKQATDFVDLSTAELALEAAAKTYGDLDPLFEIISSVRASVPMIADAEPVRQDGAPVADNSGGNLITCHKCGSNTPQCLGNPWDCRARDGNRGWPSNDPRRWMPKFEVGNRIQAGYDDDHDTGVIERIDGNLAYIAWDSHIKTSCPLSELRPIRDDEDHSDLRRCDSCPWVIGDYTERDCAHPECSPDCAWADPRKYL